MNGVKGFIAKRLTLVLAIALLMSFSVSAQTNAVTEKDLVRISPGSASRLSYSYYYYVPPELKTESAKSQTQTLLVLPNNTGMIDDDIAVHDADVKKRMLQNASIASYLNVVVLMPVFPRPKSEWQIYTHALDRDVMLTDKKEYRRLDLQLMAMIDDARERLKKEGLSIDKRVLINGFSASGMFTNRFTFLHPDRVKAAAIGSPGGWPIAPVAEYKEKKLRYPIGTADFKTVAGRKFDLKRLRYVPLFIFMGDKDENDSVPFGDSYDDEDRELIFPLLGKKPVDRWEVSKELYRSAGLNAEFKLYPSVPHTITPLMRDDIRAFLMKYKGS